MKHSLAVLTLLAVVMPAQAHFIWLLPPKDRDGAEAQMVFSDALAPDADVPITKIEKTKLFARAGKGDMIPVKMKEEKNCYQAIPEVKQGLVLVGGVCEYGVIARGKGEPFLLKYYPKTTWRMGVVREESPWVFEGNKELALEIVPIKNEAAFKVLWQGKPAAGIEIELILPGLEKKEEQKTDKNGMVQLKDAKLKDGGYCGVLAKKVEAKEGKLGDKAYKEIRHYATFTFYVDKRFIPKENQPILFVGDAKDGKADPGATKLLAEARASRAVWVDFTGFRADLTVNHNGKLHKGKVEVTGKGKVTVTLDDKEVQSQVRNEIGSLVGHRMAGPKEADTPCAFGDDKADHPLGRAINVLDDEMHSSYRIKDRQIIEVNRKTKGGRFTITVLENVWTKEKKYLPASYVVNSWDGSSALKSSRAHFHTWTRIEEYDLPATLLTVTATSEGLDSRLLTFSNVALIGGLGGSR